MTKRAIIAVMSLAMALVLLASCAPKAAPSPAPAPQAQAPAAKAPVAAAPVPSAPARPAWETEWEKTLAAAREEGKLLVSTSAGSTVRLALYNGLYKKYGIKMETISARTMELTQKILAERRAGLYFSDVLMVAAPTAIPVLKSKGVLEKLDSYLVLPEVTDPKMWLGGKLHWADADHTIYLGLSYVSVPIVINPDLVKTEELQSFRDLLNPKWKGKIVADDPVVGQLGNTLWSVLGGKTMGFDFLKELTAKQDLMFSRDWRQEMEWVVRGKYPIGLGFHAPTAFEFVQAGARLQFHIPKEGAYTAAGSGVISIGTKAPHPNASKVFANWFLSKEGQTVAVQCYGLPSGRVDVAPEGVDPSRVPQAGVNYLSIDDEEYVLESASYLEKIKDIVSPKR